MNNYKMDGTDVFNRPQCNLLRYLIFGFFLSLTLSSGSPTYAAEENVTLNLNDADIRAFIASVSEITGKNFVIDPRVKGRVTVYSATPTSPEHIYSIFLSVLKVHGYSAVPSGNVIKILPNDGAKQNNIPTETEKSTRAGDTLITRVVQVNHANASQLATILRPLLPKHAHIAAHTGSNTLVITDSAANVERLVQIINRIDQTNNYGVEIITLQHASADALAQTLKTVHKPAPGKGKTTRQAQTLIADQRTNSLILNGDPQWLNNLRLIITKLDKPVANEGNTEVIFLKYANAKGLKEVLQVVGSKTIGLSEGARAKGTTRQSNLFDITAEESTNALVLTASPHLMRTLKSVITKLDIRREQVHIEAIIVELKSDKAIELGVEWKTTVPDTGFAAVSRLPITSEAGSQLPSFPVTLGSGLSLGYLSGGNLHALLKAFAGDSDSNILSTPSLVTLDNEEALIHVGQDVPYVTGRYSNDDSNGGQNPFQTIERHDVGVKLNVTPHINDGNTVELEIEQEVSSVNTKSDVDGLVTDKRLIKTTVLVDDGEIIVLGGLIDDGLEEVENKVPVLGDIPGIGLLFKNRRTISIKRNLMVFLRPQILRDSRATREVTQKSYSSIRELELKKLDEGINLMPNATPPLLLSIEHQPLAPIEQDDTKPRASTVIEDDESAIFKMAK
ncbi:MAG: type II secretion system secretin GspD [Gammaproteobacteria bacterium]|nr:type II secretion system secretin GspD [Gammaproteobacteria bacterium]